MIHDFIKSLVKAGIDEGQAEAISAGILRAHEVANLATKADLHEVQMQMKADLCEVQRQLDAKIDKVELRIETKLAEMRGEAVWTRWMLGLIIAGIIGLMIKSFFGG